MNTEIYIFSDKLDTQQNFFLTKVLQRYRSDTTYRFAYLSHQDCKSILGSRLYKKRLEYLIADKWVKREVIGYNKYNTPVYGYTPLVFSYKRERTKSKIIMTYYQKKRCELSKLANTMYKDISHAELDISYNGFLEIYKDKFDRNFSKSIKISWDEYSEIINHTWESVTDWNNMAYKERIEYVSEDDFGNRLHTLFSRLPKSVRKRIKLWGEDVVEIDLKQSQPTLLAKLLYKNIGDNSFYNAIKNGQDVYQMLCPENRSRGKKILYYTLFGERTPKQIKKLFPDICDEINRLKWDFAEGNPSGKPYSNLAYRLQQMESNLFRKLWSALNKHKISFIPIHDSVIVQSRNIDKAILTMDLNLKPHLPYYEISVS